MAPVKVIFFSASWRVSGEYLVAQHSIQRRAVAEEPTIVVVDDDEDFRESLKDLFNSVGFKVKLFGSAAELLEGKLPEEVSCLVLDVRLPRLSGLDFQAELAKVNASIPIIFTFVIIHRPTRSKVFPSAALFRSGPRLSSRQMAAGWWISRRARS